MIFEISKKHVDPSITPPKINECSNKRDHFNRNFIFQPLIFRGYVGWGNLDGSFQVQLLVKHVLKHYSPNEIIILVHALASVIDKVSVNYRHDPPHWSLTSLCLDLQ